MGHPSEVLEVGQKVRVKIEKVNRESGKIGLTYRDLLEHPWMNAEERFPVDSIVKGKVTRTANFGAFVKLAPGIEGLVHISQLSSERVTKVSSVVKPNEIITVKVLDVDTRSRRISLSLRAAKAEEESEVLRAEDPALRKLRAKFGGDLKGGIG